jgi:hypothetical protein
MTTLAARPYLSHAAIVACVMLGSCAGRPDDTVRIVEEAGRYTLTLDSRPIAGLCYAPDSVQPNGYLSLDGFDRGNSWKTVAVEAARVDGLDRILSTRREKIGSGPFTLSVEKDAVVKRPFDLQFVAFPCHLSRNATPGARGVQLVSITADLPPFTGGTSGGQAPD